MRELRLSYLYFMYRAGRACRARCDLATRITNALPDFPEASDARVNAHINLRNIRRVLARRDPASG
jgi:hypothetical protein